MAKFARRHEFRRGFFLSDILFPVFFIKIFGEVLLVYYRSSAVLQEDVICKDCYVGCFGGVGVWE